MKKIIALIILAVALSLCFTACNVSDGSETTGVTETTQKDTEDNISTSNKPVGSTSNNSGTTNSNKTTSKSTETTKPNNPPANDEQTEMVWVTSSGTKYHSQASCSNMKSPSQITLTDAETQGYTACSKCH